MSESLVVQSERIMQTLSELDDLLAKRESLHRLHRHLQTGCSNHPNCDLWLLAIERSDGALSRRIDLTMRRLQLGV